MTADPKDWIRQAKSLVDARRARGDHPHRVGMRLVERGDFEGAVEAFREALALTPDAPWTNLSFGDALMHLGNFGEADRAFRKAAASVPSVAVAQREQIATRLIETGSIDKGIAELRSLLTMAPDRVSASMALAAALLAGSPDEQIEGATIVAELVPGDAIDPVLVADALQVLPRSVALLRHLAHIALRNGEPERARSVLTVAVAHEPHHVEVLVDLVETIVGPAVVGVTNPDELRHVHVLVENAAARDPGRIDLARARAAITELVEPWRAPAHWRALTLLDPTEERWFRRLGDSLAAVGDADGAGAAYVEAVRRGHDIY